MKLTGKQLDILKKARWLIEQDCCAYICFAISNIEYDEVETYDVQRMSPYYKLTNRISDLLGDDAYALEDWLEKEAGIPYRQLTEKRMRYYRLRWLDHMIEKGEL
jgi:hypothetical protein